MRTKGLLCAALIIALAWEGGPAAAKDIKLGGKKEETLPPKITALPTIAVAIRTDEGGWKHIQIDAWLYSKDLRTAKLLEGLKNDITARADREMPNRNYATLQSPELGSNEAKKAILSAVAGSLGHNYDGEVLIKNMLVY
jgi:hypothetical protein